MEDREDWRSEILKGVDTVEYKGCVPGFIIVYGDNSDAILTNPSGEVLIAAGEIGQGRVVVFSHNSFTKSYLKPVLPKENERLLINIVEWVSRGKGKVAVNVDAMETFDVPKDGYLVYEGDQDDEAILNEVLGWIESGGGLVCGTCPWGFSQVTGITVEEMPLNIILSKLGMCYTDQYFSTGDRLSVHDNCAEHGTISKAMTLVQLDGDLKKVSRTLANVCRLPSDAIHKIRPSVDQIKEKCCSVPTKEKPATKENEKLAASINCNLMLKESGLGKQLVAEGCHEFPGVFETVPKMETVTVEVSGFENKYVPTGCYLPAGVELELSWENVNAKGWSVVIGPHTDELFSVEGALRRWPKVSQRAALECSPMKICSPFGGLVYLLSPRQRCSLKVTLRNVVKAPRFTYETAGNWGNEVTKPGLWCDISGEHLTFTLPSKSIRHLEDPGSTMKLWDKVVEAHIDLRGCDPSNGRGQWIVTDEQPSAGYMHSGYPIVTHMDVADPCYENGDHFLMNGDGIVNPRRHGFWGVFHELGHNFQKSAWTWGGTGEVTVNIFTLHAMDVICNLKPWIHPWFGEMAGVKEYLEGGANYEVWKSDPGLALLIYAQHARDFGWEPFKTVFREYEHLSNEQTPRSDEEKTKQWMVRLSKVVGRNLCPSFEFWGFPLIEEALWSVKDLPAYLPKDETTKIMAPKRAMEIANKYGITM